MAKGLVYILTNPCLVGWVKIGYTDDNDIGQRLNSLNASTSIPLSFRVYATLRVENARNTEQRIHRLIDIIDPALHSIEKLENGRDRVREFFQISPEKAYMIFKEIAEVIGVMDDLILGIPTIKEQQEEEIVKSKRPRIGFEILGIPVGSELVFFKDENVKCTTTGNGNKVLYNGKETSLSAIASEILGYSASGPESFLYQDETLWDRRNRMESENVCDVDVA